MRPRPHVLVRVVLAAALLCVAAAAGLAVDNPEVPSGDRAGGGYDAGPTYQCDAPYDTVMNGSRNVPGGEPTGTDQAVAADCRAAGTTRFVLACTAGVLAGALLVGAGIANRRRRRPVPEGGGGGWRLRLGGRRVGAVTADHRSSSVLV